MTPLTVHRDTLVFTVNEPNRPPVVERQSLLRALRRALMALARDENGRVDRLFSGHEPDGGPARSGRHDHVFLACEDRDQDGMIDHILVVALWRADRNSPQDRRRSERFDTVASGLAVVRAGELGLIGLSPPATPARGDAIFTRSRAWITKVPFTPDRHPRREETTAAVVRELIAACIHRGFPRPVVEVTDLIEGPRGGIRAHARLTFPIAVEGPIMLGGGLFMAVHFP
jgi:CRISPR-associated protein Csb2